MRHLWLAEIKDGILVTESLHGGMNGPAPPDDADSHPSEIRGDDVVLVSRLDYDLLLFEVPPVPAKELRRLIAYRLRTEYPGRPDATQFDYLAEAADHEERRLRVYVMRQEIQARYDALARRGVLVSSDMLLRPAQPAGASMCYLVALPSYVELLEFRGGVLGASRVRALSPGTPGDDYVQELKMQTARLLGETTSNNRLSVVGTSPEITRALSDELSASGDVDSLELTETLRGRSARAASRRAGRLFEPPERRRRSGRLPSLLLAAVLCASILLYVAYAARTLRGYEKLLAGVRARYQLTEQRLAGRSKQAKQIDAERAELKKLIEQRPANAYGFFAAVAGAAPGPLELSNVTLNGTTFTIQGYVPKESSTAFAFAEDLAAIPEFHGVQIVQLVPDPVSGLVEFTVAGEYHGG